MSSSAAATSSSIIPPVLQRWFPYYFLALAVFAFYSNVYDNALLYDDKYLIGSNAYLSGWDKLGAIFATYLNSGTLRSGHFYRPLQNVLYLIIYQNFGISLFAFHLLNVGLHAANACLVFTLARRLKFNDVAAFLATLIWALHPIQTEAVTYMSSTADTLHVFFCLMALIILLPDFKQRKIWGAAAMFVLALMSKEASIILPLLAMSCLYFLSPQRLNPRAYVKLWPLWLVVALYFALRLEFLPFGKDLLNIDPVSKYFGTHISVRIYTFLATIPAYLRLLIWPTGLHMDRDFKVLLNPWFKELFFGLFFLIAASLQVICRRSKNSLPLSWGLSWLAGAYFPQTGVLAPINSLFLEHWMYLPTIGLFLGVGETLALNLPNPATRRIVSIGALAVALVFGTMTYQQNTIWHDAIVFYHNILDRGETSVRARNNLGVAYMEHGDYDKAMEQFQLSLKDYDLTPETHENIAALLSHNIDGLPHVDEEIAELKKAIAISPNFYTAYVGLDNLYMYKHDPEQAAIYRQKAEEIKKGLLLQ